jgi:hypothetical protein
MKTPIMCFIAALAIKGKKKGRTMNPLMQLNRELHFLFVALLFASFAVAQSVQAEPNQRMILFDYTTDPIICSFNEQVELHGTIRLSFTRNGNKVTASLENFEGVGLTTKREYVADTVTVVKTRISSIPMTHGFGLLISPSNLDFIATLTIPVTGMHPTDLNSTTGDPLPGQDVHFQLNYNIGWRSRNGKVTRFTPNLTGIPDGKGIISCF